MLAKFGARLAACAAACLIGAAGLFGAGAAHAQQEVACVMYEHARYGGRQLLFAPGQEIPRFNRFWNDRVSAVRVRPGCRLVAFQHHDYGGYDVSFEGDVFYVGPRLNDDLSSAVCQCGRRGAGGGGGGRGDRIVEVPGGIVGGPAAREPQPRRNQYACIAYTGDDYEGGWRAFERGRDTYDLGRRLAGNLHSIQVADGCFVTMGYGRQWKILFESSLPRLPRVYRQNAQTIRCGCYGR